MITFKERLLNPGVTMGIAESQNWFTFPDRSCRENTMELWGLIGLPGREQNVLKESNLLTDLSKCSTVDVGVERKIPPSVPDGELGLWTLSVWRQKLLLSFSSPSRLPNDLVPKFPHSSMALMTVPTPQGCCET